MKRILPIIILLCLHFAARGQVTYLDSSFNATGIVSLNHTGADDRPVVALTRPDGKSLEIGYAYFDTRTPATMLTTVTIVQYDIDGHPDPAFGEEGIVVLDQLKTDAGAAAAIFQPDGKLLITGRYLNSNSGPHHFVVRLNEDGSLDSSFGVNGVAGHPDPDLVAWGSAVAVQPDGKIIMGGNKFTFVPPGSGYFEFALIRFFPNGMVDSSFGENGIVVSGFSPDAEVLAIAVDADSMIYAGGIVDSYQSLLARYLPDGTLDSSFGVAGSVLLSDFGGVSHVVPQPNGQIVVAGAEKGWFFHGFVRRLDADGSLDPAFEDAVIGSGEHLTGIAAGPDSSIIVGIQDYYGLRVFRYGADGQLDADYDKDIPLEPEYILNRSVSLQPDGKIIVGGGHYDEFLFEDFCLLRLTETLEVDSAYGVRGFAVQNFGTNRSGATSVFTDEQNRIVVGGDATYTDATTIINYATPHSVGFVSRLLPDGALDSTFSSDGFAAVPSDPAVLNLITRQPDGKILVAGGSNLTFSYSNFGVARLLPNGTPDSSFGDFYYGFTEKFFDPDIYEAYVGAVAVAPDGGIVVMGKVVDADNLRQIAVVRFDSTGLPDPLFGIDGAVYSDAITSNFQLNGGLVQPDGKIVAAGTYFPNSGPNIFLIRFLPDGTLDDSFGTGGVVLKPVSGTSLVYRLNALTLLDDERILFCGSQGGTTNSNLIVARLNADGMKDTTFSNDGISVINTGAVESGNALAVQADGKIAVAGLSGTSGSPVHANPVLVRLLADGTPDSSFAGKGYVITDLPGDNQLKAIAIQADSSYMTTGYSNNDYLLIRYLSKISVGVLDAPALQLELLVYPNPVHGHTTFNYTLPAAKQVTLELFDMQGRRCHSFLQQAYRPQGDNTETLYFPQTLAPGVYALRIQAEGRSKSVMIMVDGW